MKRTMHKWFWAWDFDKEEQWLSQMSALGLHLSGVGFCTYVLEEGEPGAYAVRLELLDNLPSNPASERYIRFVEETGAEYVGSVMRWAYFRKRTEAGPFDLYSDVDSRIQHLNRLLSLLAVLGTLNLCNGLNNLIQFFLHGLSFSLGVGILCLLVGGLFVYGCLHVLSKRRKLQKERLLHE
jgi:hypothetical protein